MAWRYYFQIKTKWHIWRAFKLIMWLFKEQKTESSFKRASFNVDQCKRRSPTRFDTRTTIFFFININDLADESSSNTKLFADDTSLFSVVHNRDSSAAEINNDLAKTSHWAHQWKMSFNRDPNKQVVEVIFSRKVNKDSHPTPSAPLSL